MNENNMRGAHPSNLDVIERGRQNAEKLLRATERILAGETETYVCRTEDIDKRTFRRFVRTDFAITPTGKTRVDITNDDWSCWQDRFLTALTGEEFYAPEDFDAIFEECLENACSEREQKIIRLRFQESKTLEEIGKMLGLHRERIRQIESKALRRLRYPRYRYPLIYGREYEAALEDAKTAQQEYDREKLKLIKLAEEERRNAIEAKRQDAENLRGEMADMQKRDIKDFDPLNSILIDELELSVRSYNALVRHRIYVKENGETRSYYLEPICTIGQLSRLTHEELCDIVNLGKKSVKEIEGKLYEKYRITLG